MGTHDFFFPFKNFNRREGMGHRTVSVLTNDRLLEQCSTENHDHGFDMSWETILLGVGRNSVGSKSL